MQYPNARAHSLTILAVICLGAALPATGQTVLNLGQEDVVGQRDQPRPGPLSVASVSPEPVIAPLNGAVPAGAALNRPGAVPMSRAPAASRQPPPEGLHPERKDRQERVSSRVTPGVVRSPRSVATHPVIARRDAASAPGAGYPAPEDRFSSGYPAGLPDASGIGVTVGAGRIGSSGRLVPFRSRSRISGSFSE